MDGCKGSVPNSSQMDSPGEGEVADEMNLVCSRRPLRGAWLEKLPAKARQAARHRMSSFTCCDAALTSG